MCCAGSEENNWKHFCVYYSVCVCVFRNRNESSVCSLGSERNSFPYHIFSGWDSSSLLLLCPPSRAVSQQLRMGKYKVYIAQWARLVVFFFGARLECCEGGKSVITHCCVLVLAAVAHRAVVPAPVFGLDECIWE